MGRNDSADPLLVRIARPARRRVGEDRGAPTTKAELGDKRALLLTANLEDGAAFAAVEAAPKSAALAVLAIVAIVRAATVTRRGRIAIAWES